MLTYIRFFMIISVASWCELVGADRPVADPRIPEPLVFCERDDLRTAAPFWEQCQNTSIYGVILRSSVEMYENAELTVQDLSDFGHLATSKGIHKVFVRVNLPTDHSPFLETNREQTVAPIRRFVAACQSAAHQNIYVDSDGTAPIFSYSWDGYDWDTYPPVRLAAQAYQFGKSLALMLRRFSPSGEVLIALPMDGVAGPLWFRWFEGFLENASTSLLTCVHVVIRSSELLDTEEKIQTLWNHIQFRLSPRARKRAREYCGLAIQWTRTCPDVRAVIPSLLVSTRYIVLSDSKAMAVMKEPLVLTRGLLKPFFRVSFYKPSDMSERYFVLRGEKGAAVICQDRATLEKMVRSAHSAMRTDMTTGETRQDCDDWEDLSLQGPFLVYPLAAQEWVTPACMWWEMEPSIKDSEPIVHFGLTNRTGFSLHGTLGLAVRGKGDVLPAIIPLDLAPDEQASVESTLQGIKDRPCTIPATLTLTSPDLRPVERPFLLQVPPDIEWQAHLEGGIQGMTGCVIDEEDSVVVTTDAGEFAALSTQGKMLWRQWFRCCFATGPVLTEDFIGNQQLLALTTRGELIECSPLGVPVWRKQLLTGPPASIPLKANLNVFPGDEIILVGTGGTIMAVVSNGAELWRHTYSSSLCSVGIVPKAFNTLDGVYILTRGPSPELIVLSSRGKEVFRTPIPYEPSCAFSSTLIEKSDRPLVFVGGIQGEVQVRDGTFGCLLAHDTALETIRGFLQGYDEGKRVGWYTRRELYFWDMQNPPETWDTGFDISSLAPSMKQTFPVVFWGSAGRFVKYAFDDIVRWDDPQFDGLRLTGLMWTESTSNNTTQRLLLSTDGAVVAYVLK